MNMAIFANSNNNESKCLIAEGDESNTEVAKRLAKSIDTIANLYRKKERKKEYGDIRQCESNTKLLRD